MEQRDHTLISNKNNELLELILSIRFFFFFLDPSPGVPFNYFIFFSVLKEDSIPAQADMAGSCCFS